MFNRKKEYEMLNKMLDDAIAGEFDETLYDESELSKLQAKLERYLSTSAISARRVYSEKDNLKELITNISHQTKTPLTNILLYSQLLEEHAESEDIKTYADEIAIYAKKLDLLIDSLVKMSRLEVGVFQFEIKRESLTDIVRTIVDMGSKKALDKNVAIHIDGEMDGTAIFDMKWTVEAIYNILDNAIKYSESNSEIWIKILQYEMFACIRIKDQGIGMSEDEIPRIFSRFYRGKEVHDKEGIGVGLYLAREIVEGQGGYIKVMSEKGNGSNFEVYLPK